MSAANQVELDLWELLDEARKNGEVIPVTVKLGKGKKPAKTQTQKLLAKKPDIEEPVVLPDPVAVANTYMVVSCSCGSESKFLISSRIKLEHKVKSGRSWSFVSTEGFFPEVVANLPEEITEQLVKATACDQCSYF